MASIFLGTLGLTLAALVAFILTFTRGAVAAERVPRIRRIASVAILLQLGHFLEETEYQFYVRFPELLGLAPWPRQFFVAFNSSWLVVWLLSVVGVTAFQRASAFALWFLALASVANGIIHPLVSLSVAGYFPGLWSSPFVGILGAMLFVSLISATDTRGQQHHAGRQFEERACAPPNNALQTDVSNRQRFCKRKSKIAASLPRR
jgi:hypothetical protein